MNGSPISEYYMNGYIFHTFTNIVNDCGFHAEGMPYEWRCFSVSECVIIV
jgi:hypothetical protein